MARILHVISSISPRYGGPSKAALEMAKVMFDNGHKVSIFTTDIDGESRLQVDYDKPMVRDGVEITYFPVQFPRSWCTSLAMAQSLSRNILDFDIVWIHSLYLFHGAFAAYFCRKNHIPYVIRPHGTLDPMIFCRKRLLKSILEILFENRNIRYAAAIHFTSDEEKYLAQKHIFNTPSFVLPLGLFMDEYRRLPEYGLFRNQYSFIGNKKVILFLGRINFKKGLDILIECFANLLKLRNDVHLVIAGPDNEGYGKSVKKWIQEKNIVEHVTFTGMLQGELKLAAYKDSNLFILPSYSENFGIAVIEAMASGTPVLISDKVNIWREIESAEAGMVSPCDAESFSKIASFILDNPSISKKLSQNGKQLIHEKFEWKTISRSLNLQIQRLLPSTIDTNQH